ncbi:MAG: hypothetical protein IPJ03_15765 [Ignavibacteriales bacterium]|nr:hypothetical protein [Ignavibacteriales bacterium]
MSLTNYQNGVSSFGVPMIGGGLPATFGTYYFVDADVGSDLNDGLSRDTPFATIDKAVDSVTTNKDDVIVLGTNSSHQITEMLSISKSRVHLVGDMFGRMYGQRAKINYADGIATADAFAVKNTGVGNTFTGIKFLNANTDAQVVATFGEGGEYTVFRNCEFYNSCDLDSNTEAEMVLNGDSAQFFNCTFGSLADAVSGDKIRPAILLTAATVAAGKVSRDVYFDSCRFWKKAGGTTTAFIKGAAADVERVMEFHDCQFIANVLGAVPAVAIDVATLTVGQIILTGDTAAFECTKIATATGVISGLTVKTASTTIGIQAS